MKTILVVFLVGVVVGLTNGEPILVDPNKDTSLTPGNVNQGNINLDEFFGKIVADGALVSPSPGHPFVVSPIMKEDENDSGEENQEDALSRNRRSPQRGDYGGYHRGGDYGSYRSRGNRWGGDRRGGGGYGHRHHGDHHHHRHRPYRGRNRMMNDY